MDDESEIVLREIRLLIKDSCDFVMEPNEEFKNFHKSFLKFSFGVLDVEINYATKSISTWNSKPLTGSTIDLRNFGDALLEKLNYVDLEETLLGCVEQGVFNERFYKHLLSDFDRINDENDIKTA
ncbi:hypothetical protein EI546_13825 [Aequorivita sp. H23M31]|uniref:Uncharacterized protein n=1 Tax=Aequorivita ciconiae TaxID=2494375 RepID=A0A410G635_9FLAO|nr:hypothetical protein [Aequorivita sp. H23M31]QAA82732.1 hypothetical protein EI546_13825 [Aequorivita sp. H23M31]